MTMDQMNPEMTQAEAELKVPCEIYSRIVGYLRPVQNWHQGKQQEFSERKTFCVPETDGQREAS
ncbi:MAG: anaerobic ribonucleoside-triphosphate reductase [Chloroflexota bacterium]|nr:anaerobic ribonucleoside-triphosphate reductase [Chloroflexota bacterium]